MNSGLAGASKKEAMESSNNMVLRRGAVLGLEVGGDGGGVAWEGFSEERGLVRVSRSEKGSRVNYFGVSQYRQRQALLYPETQS